jgi:AraC family transcriptional regulator
MNAPSRPNVGILILAFGAFLVLAIGFFMVRLGYFKNMEAKEVERQSTLLLYKPHTGAYHRVNATILEVEAWAKSNGIPCPHTFGEYLDDPSKVEEERLRANAGCILSTPLTTASLPEQRPEGLDVKPLPAGRYLSITFQGSPAIGPMKVYPYAKGYFRDKNWGGYETAVEIYTIVSPSQMTTEYLFATPAAN